MNNLRPRKYALRNEANSLRSPRLRVRPFSPSYLFVSFAFFLWTVTLFAFATQVVAKEPEKAPFANEIAAFEKWDHQNAVPREAILFVGSSTIRMWQTADAFPDLPIINRGFGGSTIADVNLYADKIVFKYKPRTIVFYAGDNDIAGGRSPDQVVNDFATFARNVHDRLPETRLIYLAIKPSIARWQLWPKMQEVNSRIKAILDQNTHFAYVDTAPVLLGSAGKPDKANFREDGLHMSEQGYTKWNELVAEKLK